MFVAEKVLLLVVISLTAHSADLAQLAFFCVDFKITKVMSRENQVTQGGSTPTKILTYRTLQELG